MKQIGKAAIVLCLLTGCVNIQDHQSGELPVRFQVARIDGEPNGISFCCTLSYPLPRDQELGTGGKRTTKFCLDQRTVVVAREEKGDFIRVPYEIYFSLRNGVRTTTSAIARTRVVGPIPLWRRIEKETKKRGYTVVNIFVKERDLGKTSMVRVSYVDGCVDPGTNSHSVDIELRSAKFTP